MSLSGSHIPIIPAFRNVAFLRFGQEGKTAQGPNLLRKKIANLRRKRSANNPVGDGNFEIAVAIEACNRLVGHLSATNTGRNMNLLLSFTA